mgnify:CR=1 FL=1
MIIISSLILSSNSLGQSENMQKNYVKFNEMANGDIFNFTYGNEIIINSITITPRIQGYWSENGVQKQFLSERIREKIIGIKSPIIDIQAKGNVSIKIVFNNLSLSKAISFNGFFINNINGIGFINGGNFYILNSTLYINSTKNLSVKIFIETNETIGEFSQYMQSNEFDGIIYLNTSILTVEFTNQSMEISSMKINGETLSLSIISNESDGFLILDLMGYEKPLNITINGISFKNSTMNNVVNESVNSYAIKSINDSIIYFIYLSNIPGNYFQQNNIYEFSFVLSVLFIVLLASAITLRKLVKK